MQSIDKLIGEIAETPDCAVVKRAFTIGVDLIGNIPEDLQYYLQNYQSVTFYETSKYPTVIVGLEDFKRANPIIVGENVEDDISYQWFIIGDGGNSQYITIDLSSEHS